MVHNLEFEICACGPKFAGCGNGKGMVIGMGDLDFSTLGQEIGEKIEQFVNSREMKDVQENIRRTVEGRMEDVRRSTKDMADYVNKNMEAYQGSFAKGAHKESRERTYPESQRRQLPVVRRPQGRVIGILLTIFGTCGAIIGWPLALLGYTATFVAGMMEEGIVASSVLGVFAAACTFAAVAGGFLRRRAGRFRKYVKTMGQKDFYAIKGLAEAVHKSEKFVVKDLKKMIHKGWFKEGHLDAQETCFMLTEESYQLYLNAQKELERRKEEADRLAREQEMLENDPVRKQVKLTVEEGNEYIRRIRNINDDIPGEDISNKLYRLERVCKEIFDHIEDNPEKLPDIRKFMSYYMPTTLKLVQTYHEFSEQPVQGENITSAKKEIEEMLDNINQAFEKMFDKLFADDAMDISTDISVMSTMLAQEGLLEDGIKVK